jgi:hypothetical protein
MHCYRLISLFSKDEAGCERERCMETFNLVEKSRTNKDKEGIRG